MPYKRCPQCGTWLYSAAALEYWECSACDSDISDVPMQNDPPQEAFDAMRRVRPEDLTILADGLRDRLKKHREPKE